MEYNNTMTAEQKDYANTTLGHNFLKEVMTYTEYKIGKIISFKFYPYFGRFLLLPSSF